MKQRYRLSCLKQDMCTINVYYRLFFCDYRASLVDVIQVVWWVLVMVFISHSFHSDVGFVFVYGWSFSFPILIMGSTFHCHTCPV